MELLPLYDLRYGAWLRPGEYSREQDFLATFKALNFTKADMNL